MSDVDWAALRAAAIEVAKRAYAPYSNFAVGAAGLVSVASHNRIVTGCNVESASYGLTLCAECGLVSALHASGGGQLVALSVVNSHGESLSPCGRCRQLILEHGAECLIDTAAGPRHIIDLLPEPFGFSPPSHATQ